MSKPFPSGIVVGRRGTRAYFDGMHGPFPVRVDAVRETGGRTEVLVVGRSPLPEDDPGNPTGADYGGWWPASMVFPRACLYGQYMNKIAPYRWEVTP